MPELQKKLEIGWEHGKVSVQVVALFVAVALAYLEEYRPQVFFKRQYAFKKRIGEGG